MSSMPAPPPPVSPKDGTSKVKPIVTSKQVVKKKALKKRNNNRGINLLSDTGLAFRKAEMKFQVFRYGTIFLVVMLLFAASGLGFWFYEKQQMQQIEDQIETLESQLVDLKPVIDISREYQQRLRTIQSLVTVDDEKQQPGPLLQKIQEIALLIDANVHNFSYDKKQIMTNFKVYSLDNVNQGLQLLESEGEFGWWHDVEVDNFSRIDRFITDTEYDLEITASIVPKSSKR